MLQLDIGTLASSNSFHSVKATPLRCHVNGQTIGRHRGLYSDVIVAAVHVSAVLPIAAAAILHNNHPVSHHPVSHHPAAPLDAWHYKLLPTTSTLTIRRCLQMALAVMVQLQVHSTAAASASGQSKQPSGLLLQLPLTSILSFQVLTGSSLAADLLESNLSSEGNIPSELSAAGGFSATFVATSATQQFSNVPGIAGCCSPFPCGHLAGCQLHAHCGLAQG